MKTFATCLLPLYHLLELCLNFFARNFMTEVRLGFHRGNVAMISHFDHNAIFSMRTSMTACITQYNQDLVEISVNHIWLLESKTCFLSPRAKIQFLALALYLNTLARADQLVGTQHLGCMPHYSLPL